MLPASNCQLSVVVSQLPFILLIRGHKVMLSIERMNGNGTTTTLNWQLSVVVSQLPFILLIRGHKVMLSIELANLYQVEPRALIQAIKRNLNRFPSDFMFQLMAEEWENLKSQFVISSWGGVRTPPYAFTEQGVAMLSSVLNSDRAVQGQHRDHARLRAVAAVAGVQR